ncbi:pali-domain-containing protein [Trametopsis cervina]|nr:pali-domain-containing protein [Trametopsis cervina]
MAAGAAVPGLFFVFAAMVLLIFASVSAPTWDRISFLNSEGLRFGVFGYSGSSTHVGYKFPSPIGDGDINGGVLHNLTFTLILIPIAAGLSGLAFIFGSCGAAYHRSGTVFMSLLSALAFLVTLIAWVLEMVLFGIAHHRASDRGIAVKWGNANWIVLGALGSLFVGFILATCGIFGSYRQSRRTAY